MQRHWYHRLGRAFVWRMQENLVQLHRLLNVHGHTFHVHNAPSRTHAKRGDVPDASFHFSIISPTWSCLHLHISHHVFNHQSLHKEHCFSFLDSHSLDLIEGDVTLLFMGLPCVIAHGLGSLPALCPTESMPG